MKDTNKIKFLAGTDRIKVLEGILKKLSDDFEVEIIMYPREMIRKKVKSIIARIK